MHIRCKFDGGKNINRIQSGSWQNRCYAYGEGLRQNLGMKWGPIVWEESDRLGTNIIMFTYILHFALVSIVPDG